MEHIGDIIKSAYDINGRKLSKGTTTTEIISKLLKSLPEAEWDLKIPAAALFWNKNHYRLPDNVVISMYESLKSLEKTVRSL